MNFAYNTRSCHRICTEFLGDRMTH